MRLIFITICLLAITGCATSPTGRSQLALMPESYLDQMGAQAFKEIGKKTPVERNEVTNSYVQCVAGAITREVGGRWKVRVFRDDAANAFALPGNKIGVYTGLLKVAKNQHQLATVIGHEVAHVRANHANERVSQKFAVDQGLYLVNALASPQSGTGQTVMGLLGVGAQFGILMPYSRIQESEADIYGLELMARAGFDPGESIQLWKNMARAGGGQPPEFLSTHPSHTTRISGLSGHMAKARQIQEQARQSGRRPACD